MSMKVAASARRSLSVTSDKITNLVRWIFFSVCIGVVPIIYNCLDLVLHKKPLDLNVVLAHGDLLLVSIVLLADAMGELVINDQIKKPINVIMSGSSCFLVVVSCLLFARISPADSQAIDKNFVVVYSFACFSWMIIIGTICKWLKEK